MTTSAYVSPETRYLSLEEPFHLESGRVLQDVVVAYRTWGTLDVRAANAVLVCHALTGSADVDLWWPGLLGPGRALDPQQDFVVASNVLGGCYGTTGPSGPAPPGKGPHGPGFPAVTIRDQVRLQGRLLEALGVRSLRMVVGGSMGGMHALEWAVMRPLPVEAVVAIGAPPRHSSWAIGLGEVQRQAVRGDPDWRGGRYLPERPPRNGLAAARMVAMCTYRSPESFQARFGRHRHAEGPFQVESYLRHQGEKLAGRFDANSYLVLTEAMDSHDLARDRGTLEEVLQTVELPVLILGIPTDVLYLPWELRELGDGLPAGAIAWIDSPHGHDAFLMEREQVDCAIRSFRLTVSGAGSNEDKNARAERCA